MQRRSQIQSPRARATLRMKAYSQYAVAVEAAAISIAADTYPDHRCCYRHVPPDAIARMKARLAKEIATNLERRNIRMLGSGRGYVQV